MEAAHSLSDALFSTPHAARALSDDAHLRRLIEFERALARAQGRVGVIAPAYASTINDVLRSYPLPEGDGRARLFADAAKAGTMVVPLVKLLTAAVRTVAPDAAGFVHFGATSQDAIDTAHGLQFRDALDAVLADARRLAAACARQAQAHRRTLMLGRTLLQPATPITFGLKAAQWLAGVADALIRIERERDAALVLQFGGAAGTLGSLGERGPAVAEALAEELGLDAPPVPWHVRRGNMAALGAALGVLCGHAGKIARDLSLMMQYELAEAFEPSGEGRGGSSAMPHKRNPVRCMLALADATRAPGLVSTLMAGLVEEHERALGPWQAEWAVWPALLGCAAGAVAAMADAVEGLVVDGERMRANFDALRGLPMTEAVSLALAPRLGRDVAHAAVEAAARAVAATPGTSLRDALATDARVTDALDAPALDRLLDPSCALGAADAFIEAALEQATSAQKRPS